jgi:hypothetical protein
LLLLLAALLPLLLLSLRLHQVCPEAGLCTVGKEKEAAAAAAVAVATAVAAAAR